MDAAHLKSTRRGHLQAAPQALCERGATPHTQALGCPDPILTGPHMVQGNGKHCIESDVVLALRILGQPF